MKPWRRAWQDALYGPDGFYRREQPSAHFRTASHAAPGLLAQALSALLRRHGLSRVVEIGCGAGELLTALAALRPEVSLIGAELRPRPVALPSAIQWCDELPQLDERPTLLLAWELLDVLPVTIAERASDGVLREVLVDVDGRQALGDRLGPDDDSWCRRWQGELLVGERVEVGRARDEFWAATVGALPNGLALAVDYGHSVAPHAPTLTSFRAGREVRPVPDGSCDLTSHVRWDSLSRAVQRATGQTSNLLSQRDALGELLSELPVAPAAARTDPAGYLRALDRRGRLAELRDPAGLGAFGWLLTPCGASR